jgi:hypothetical protein
MDLKDIEVDLMAQIKQMEDKLATESMSPTSSTGSASSSSGQLGETTYELC